jgi:arylsulfatase A-like enzyme/Tfp pilus assembly protein PilF
VKRAIGVGAALAITLGVLTALGVFRGGKAVRREAGLDVLLITIDTLRADALGAYGNATAQTPWMDRLAAGGVRFARAHAHNVVTLPSHANILSGQYPLGHGVRDNNGFRFPAGTPTLAALLKARGYRTAAFVSAFPLDSRFGLDQGFDVYDDRLGGAETTTAFVMPERSGTDTVALARRWLDQPHEGPAFAFVHLYEPHFPYVPPEPLAARFGPNPYLGEVAAADAALEPLLRPLLEGATPRTLVVLTSDHGEGLGEHDELTHGVFAYESTLHVPLLLFAPRILKPGVVAEPVRHVDVMPTILDALGLEPPAGLPGRSLLPLANGGAASPGNTYFEALSSSLNQGWAPLRGVVASDLKYVDLPLPELYDLAADPRESRNLAASRPQDLDRMRSLLARARDGERGIERVAEDAATLERLRALGYAAGGGDAAKERYTEADDPKRLIEVDRRAREVVRLYMAGDVEGALVQVKENIRQRPQMPQAWLHLAYLERKRGDLTAAVAAARKAFELRPMDAENVSLYAVYLTESGRAREAVAVLEPYMSRVEPDLDLLTAYGMGLTAVGRGQDALAAFERARRLDPSNPMVLVNIGTVFLMAGDRGRARQAFEGALDIDTRVARAQNSLGVIAAQEGRLDEAIERWKRAVALDPRDYQTLFNLGSVLRNQGREAEARPYLESYLASAPRALEARDIARVRAWLGAPSANAGT